jgi:hypothetical protein
VGKYLFVWIWQRNHLSYFTLIWIVGGFFCRKTSDFRSFIEKIESWKTQVCTSGLFMTVHPRPGWISIYNRDGFIVGVLRGAVHPSCLGKRAYNGVHLE